MGSAIALRLVIRLGRLQPLENGDFFGIQQPGAGAFLKSVDKIQVKGMDEVGVVIPLEVPLKQPAGSVDLGFPYINQGVGHSHRKILRPVVLPAGRVAVGCVQR